MTYGDVIREARERRGWTQQELADALATSTTSISNWERQNTRPSVEDTNALCRILGIPVDVIVSAFGYELSLGLAGRIPRELLLDLVACPPETLAAIRHIAAIAAREHRPERGR